MKLKSIWSVVKNSIVAILRGEFLLSLKVGRYLLHIIYTFFLFAVVIWFSLAVENSMAKVQQNNREIEELQIAKDQKTFELVRLSKRSSVKERLEKMGSDVIENAKPAYRLEK